MPDGEGSNWSDNAPGIIDGGKVRIIIKSSGTERTELTTELGTVDCRAGSGYYIVISGGGFNIRVHAEGDATIALSGDVRGISTYAGDRTAGTGSAPASTSYSYGGATHED